MSLVPFLSTLSLRQAAYAPARFAFAVFGGTTGSAPSPTPLPSPTPINDWNSLYLIAYVIPILFVLIAVSYLVGRVVRNKRESKDSELYSKILERAAPDIKLDRVHHAAKDSAATPAIFISYRRDVVFAFHDKDEIGPKMLAQIAKHTSFEPRSVIECLSQRANILPNKHEASTRS